MSLKTILIAVEQDVLDFLTGAGKAIAAFAISETQKLVAEVKQTDLGTLALNLVQLLASHDLAGPAKLDAVVAALVPALTALEAKGGLAGLVTSIEDFARELAQSAYNDFKAALAKVAPSA